jgi:hypothetical protein
MSIVSSSSAPDYSSPDISSIAGVSIKRLPPGEALGASDLQQWAARRLSGRFGVSPNSVEKTAAGDWVVLSNDKTIGGFKSRRAAWEWIKRRRRGG